MKEVTTNQQIWNSAAKDGAVLACITIGAGVINILISKMAGNGASSTAFSMAAMAISAILWLAKTVGSFLLLKKQIENFGTACGNPGKRFGYGVKVTLLSSILCAVFVAVNLLYISPDSTAATWDAVMQLYKGQLDSNSIEMLEAMKGYIPLYSTIGQFIWIFLLGIIYSGIISSMQRNNTPFNNTANPSDGQ